MAILPVLIMISVARAEAEGGRVPASSADLVSEHVGGDASRSAMDTAEKGRVVPAGVYVPPIVVTIVMKGGGDFASNTDPYSILANSMNFYIFIVTLILAGIVFLGYRHINAIREKVKKELEEYCRGQIREETRVVMQRLLESQQESQIPVRDRVKPTEQESNANKQFGAAKGE